MATIAHANSITRVSTSADFPLGYEVEVPATSENSSSHTNMGTQVWVYVFNDDAASLLQGTIVARDAGTTTYDGIVAPADSPTIRVMGVAQHTIAASSYGFILRKGIGEVLADTGGIGVNLPMVVGNAVNGRADTTGVAATTYAFGFSTETVTATNLATCWINCPG